MSGFIWGQQPTQLPAAPVANSNWAHFGQAPAAPSDPDPDPWGQTQPAAPSFQQNHFGFPAQAQVQAQAQAQNHAMGNGTNGLFGSGQVAGNPWSANGAEFNGSGGQFMASTPNPFAVSLEQNMLTFFKPITKM